MPGWCRAPMAISMAPQPTVERTTSGTVFRMTTNGTLTTLASFNYANGASPQAGLVQGADGNFYGTTEDGGYGNGTVFRMTTNGTLTTLLSFRGTNGTLPPSRAAAGRRRQFLWHYILRRSGLQWRVLQRRWDYLPPRSGPHSDDAGDYRTTRQPDRARQQRGDLQRQCQRRRPVELLLAAQRQSDRRRDTVQLHHQQCPVD